MAGYRQVLECTGISDRVCKPTISCQDQCPTGQYQSEPCVNDAVPKVCKKCKTSCGVGMFMSSPCSRVEGSMEGGCIPGQYKGMRSNPISGVLFAWHRYA